MSQRPDSQIAARLRSARLHTKHERTAEAVVLKAMSEWLDSARYLLLREVRNYLPGLTAASYPPPMGAIDAVVASYNVWRQQTETNVLPQIGVAFGEAFQQVRRSADYSSFRWEQAYLEQVSDRLRIWPEGAFEELRPELLEALAEAEDYDQIVARVGRILTIDAATGAIRADINEVDKELMDPDTGPARIPVLEARRRRLWADHDESLGEWQWKARRIARTEIHGAILGGRTAAARAVEIATGDPLWKRWLSTDDSRVRLSHRVADGQVVKLAEPFRVGGFLLQYPGDPITIAPHETIDCRCDLNFLDYDELQDELQGQDGSTGEVRPGGIRIGPDDPDDADAAIDRLAEETRRPKPARARGEDHGQQLPTLGDPVEADPDHTPQRPLPDLSGLTDEQLTEAMFDAEDDERYEYLAAEADRRADIFEDGDDFGDDGDERDLDDDPEDFDGPPLHDDELETTLDDYFEQVIEPTVTADERAAVERWQGMDRFYQRVQEAARRDDTIEEERVPDAEAVGVGDHLDDLISRSPLPADVQVWRGIRDATALFGLPNSDLAQLAGQVIEQRGYFATSVAREQAIGAFTRPPLGGGPVLLDVVARAGTPALWVARAGNDAMAEQRELLFDSLTVFTVLAVTYDGDVPTVHIEIQ